MAKIFLGTCSRELACATDTSNRAVDLQVVCGSSRPWEVHVCSSLEGSKSKANELASDGWAGLPVFSAIKVTYCWEVRPDPDQVRTMSYALDVGLFRPRGQLAFANLL